MIGQLTFPGIPPMPKAALSQWFTKPELARRIVRWARPQPGMRILEPSAGCGSFVEPLMDYRVPVEALEIDPEWVDHLLEEYGGYPDLTVRREDFTTWKPDCRFSMCIMNPPYEGGQDMAHVVRALELCDRVIALVRLNFLSSKERYEGIWRHVALKRQINFIDRPCFSGAGSPRHDFCVVDMARHPFPPKAVQQVEVEWWYANR